MKITALMPNDLVSEVVRYSGGKNTTESLLIALREWLALKKITRLNKQVIKKPLKFQKSFSAKQIRSLNRS